MLNTKYSPGFRAIKTSIAIFLCFLVGMLLGRESMFYACIASVICMQTTSDKTFTIGVNRFIGTVVGGVVGFFTLELLQWARPAVDWLYIVLLPLCVLLLIYICNVFNIKNSVGICCVVFLSITAHGDREIPDALIYVVNRVIDTTIGIVIAILVNRFIVSNDPEPPTSLLDPTPHGPVLTGREDSQPSQKPKAVEKENSASQMPAQPHHQEESP